MLIVIDARFLSVRSLQVGQHEQSAELTERALHAIEQTLHPLCSLLDGRARLDFAHAPNQPLFLALFRHMIACGRRGLPRTALEIGRLLLSLSPHEDPMRALLHLDTYALLVRDPQAIEWLVQLPTQLRMHSLPLWPSYAFSLALARRRLAERLMHAERRLDESEEAAARHAAAVAEAEAAASAQLRRALLLFPAVVPSLLEHLAAKGQPPMPLPETLLRAWAALHGARASEHALSPTLGKLVRLYVVKSAAVWGQPGVRAWLVAEVECLLEAMRALPPTAAAHATPAAAAEPMGMLAARLGHLKGSPPPPPLAITWATLTREQRTLAMQWREAQLAVSCEYCASSAREKELITVDMVDFEPQPPAALPDEHLAFAQRDGAAAGRWVRIPPAARALRPEGRLVIPRDEWVTLRPDTHPFLQFWYSMLPWTVAPHPPRRG